MNETLKLMGDTPGERLTPAVTREICLRTGSKAMVTGSIAPLGTQFVIGLKVVNCNTGDVLAEAQQQAAEKKGFKALDIASFNLRGRLGESVNSVQKYDTPLEEATTSSLEALKAYSAGIKSADQQGSTAALPYFKKATELDPNFATAYVWMAEILTNLNQIGLSAEYARRAYDLRDRVSERERFLIESNYFLYTTGELYKAAQIIKLWQQSYPRYSLPYVELGLIFGYLGDWNNALEQFQTALRLDPSNAMNYSNLGTTYMAFNRMDDAAALYRQARERKIENEGLYQSPYWLAFLDGDTSRMSQLIAAATGKAGAEDLMLSTEADTEGWHGRLSKAHQVTLRAIDLAERNNATETAAAYRAAAALREVECGQAEQARLDALAAVKQAPNRDVRSIAALGLARAGDTLDAERLAAEIERAFRWTRSRVYWLPAVRAAVALQRNNPQEAIALLEVSQPIELGESTNVTVYMSPVYVRGEAYLALRDGKSAAAEFRKFIDHRGIALNFPWGSLARLGLARAYVMQGDKAKAKATYKDFLTIWKDADPDLPIYQRAKAEYLKLQ